MDYPPKVHPHGAVQSMSSLHTYIADEYFHNREMKVRCEASFSPVLWVGTKESTVLEEKVFRSKEASFCKWSFVKPFPFFITYFFPLEEPTTLLG